MTDITWTPGLTLQVDAAMTRDYSLNLPLWLGAHTVAAYTITATNCTVTNKTSTATTVGFRVSAVLPGAQVTINVVDESGQVDNFSVYFSPSVH